VNASRAFDDNCMILKKLNEIQAMVCLQIYQNEAMHARCLLNENNARCLLNENMVVDLKYVNSMIEIKTQWLS
jgi:hypothetical protein